MAHFNQLQLRSVDNQGNCSSQHSDPVHYFGSPCVVPLALRPPEYCLTLQPAQPDAAPLPSWSQLLAVGLKSQIPGWDEAASGNQLELVQELIAR